jgi:hypothetical protein
VKGNVSGLRTNTLIISSAYKYSFVAFREPSLDPALARHPRAPARFKRTSELPSALAVAMGEGGRGVHSQFELDLKYIAPKF